MKAVIIGDLHFKKDEPFFSAQKEFCKWFLNQNFNRKENILINSGDLFDKSVPNPSIYEYAINWHKQMNFKEIFILSGNHDFCRVKNSYSTEPLTSLDNIKVIYKPEIICFNNFKILFLPFLYDKTCNSNSLTQKEFYSLYSKNFKDKCDIIIFHFEDETIQFGGESNGIDLSWCEGERIGGHIHKKQAGYLGSPLITRYDEREKESFILLIDLDTKEKEYVKVPQFLDYVTIDYESAIVRPIVQFPIFDIINAPSREAAEEKFKGLYIRNIELKKDEENLSLIEESKESLTIKEYFSNFCAKNKVAKKIQEKLVNYI